MCTAAQIRDLGTHVQRETNTQAVAPKQGFGERNEGSLGGKNAALVFGIQKARVETHTFSPIWKDITSGGIGTIAHTRH
jgi:hypothetical protein